MRWIGLTGGIGTGKTAVSRILKRRGFPVVDADELAREAVRPGAKVLQDLRRVFGPEIFKPDSDSLDRKALGELVFSDPGKLSELENLIHPSIRALADQERERLQEEGFSVAFYAVPLLYEKGMQELFDEIICVYCRPEIQLQRILTRDGISQRQAEERLSSQWPIAEKSKLADFVILNEGSLTELEFEVLRTLNAMKLSESYQDQLYPRLM